MIHKGKNVCNNSKKNSFIHQYNMRNKTEIIPTDHRLEFYKRNYLMIIKEENCLPKFKNKSKQHFTNTIIIINLFHKRVFICVIMKAQFAIQIYFLFGERMGSV